MPVEVLGDKKIIIVIVPVLGIATPSYRVNLGSVTIIRYRSFASSRVVLALPTVDPEGRVHIDGVLVLWLKPDRLNRDWRLKPKKPPDHQLLLLRSRLIDVTLTLLPLEQKQSIRTPNKPMHDCVNTNLTHAKHLITTNLCAIATLHIFHRSRSPREKRQGPSNEFGASHPKPLPSVVRYRLKAH